MDHENCPNESKALLNIIGGKGAISNINYYYDIDSIPKYKYLTKQGSSAYVSYWAVPCELRNILI